MRILNSPGSISCRSDRHHARVLPALLVLVIIFLAGTPSSAPAAGQIPSDGFAFDADIGVDPADAEFVIESARFAERMFSSQLGFDPIRELTVSARATDYELSGETYGIYEFDRIDIFTGSAAWFSRPGVERLKGVVHEYTHYYLDPTPHPRNRPIWLEEGISEYLAWRLLSDADLITREEIVAYHAGFVRIYPPGENLCGMTQSSISGREYPLTHLAVTALVERAGFGSIRAYRDTMASGVPHAEAFAAAFGIDEEEFCSGAMDSIWEFTPASSVPIDLYIGTTDTPPTSVLFLKAPMQATSGDQLLIRARTSELVRCSLDLDHPSLDSDDPTRETTADGDGDMFWLVTVPVEITSGLLTLRTTCGPITTLARIAIES